MDWLPRRRRAGPEAPGKVADFYAIEGEPRRKRNWLSQLY